MWERLSSLFWHRIKVSIRLSGWFLQMINAKLLGVRNAFLKRWKKCDLIRVWARNTFLHDKRKVVLIRGLETPFWNAEKSAIWNAFEPETRFCRDDKRKVVLIRGLETPFWTAEKSAIWNAFEPEIRFCRDDKRKVVLKHLYISDRPTRRVPYMICALRVKLCNAAAQWQGLPLDSYSR